MSNGQIFRFGPFRLDAVERMLFRDGEPVTIPPKAFDLLSLLVKAAGHRKSRDELIEALWPKAIVVENSLNWHVAIVRKALGEEDGGTHYIETVRGHGYRFAVPVEVETAVPTPPGEGQAPAPLAPSAGENPAATSVPGRRWFGQRSAAIALGASVLIVIAGLLIWRFALYGPTGKDTTTPVIAVLPFENLSADPTNAYFTAGIQDTILSKLARIGELRVISRTSTMHYPSHPANLKQVAAQLGATAAIEGSVQKTGERVLINVQLIDAKTDQHIWAQVYKRSLQNIFSIETDVATRVAAALQAKLLPSETTRLARTPTHNPQAYLLFLKANYYADQVMVSNSATNPAAAVAQATRLYHQAITRDPGFALAYARLSLLDSHFYRYEIIRKPQIVANAEWAAKQALALRPSLPEAHLAMGYVQYYGYHNYTDALAEFERIPEKIRNNNAGVMGATAFVHRRQGKWQEALTGLRQAAKLDPRNPRWLTEIGVTLMALRDYMQAEQQFDRALALEPHDYNASAFKVMTLLFSGKPLQQARQMLASIPVDSGQQGLMPALHFEIEQLARRPKAALTALNDAPDWISSPNAAGREPTALLRAKAWAGQGDEPLARKAYEKARNMLKAALLIQHKSSSLWSFLGLAEAGLGQRSKAIRAGLKAISLTGASGDSVTKPSHLLTLAKIYARTGEPNQAVKLLQRLLAIPAGGYISLSMLERDPVWDPLRHDLGFQTLLEKSKYEAPPTPTSTSH